MRCKNCGAQNTDTAVQCQNCGAYLKKKNDVPPADLSAAAKPNRNPKQTAAIAIAISAVTVFIAAGVVFAIRGQRDRAEEDSTLLTSFSSEATTRTASGGKHTTQAYTTQASTTQAPATETTTQAPETTQEPTTTTTTEPVTVSTTAPTQQETVPEENQAHG